VIYVAEKTVSSLPNFRAAGRWA